MEDLARRKLREATDFEWQRCLRFYFTSAEDEPEKGKENQIVVRLTGVPLNVTCFTGHCRS